MYIINAARELIVTFEQSLSQRIDNERLNAELEQAQSLARLGSWSFTLATGELAWSKEMYRIFGVSTDTFTPSVDGFINLIHPHDQASMKVWIAACNSGEKPVAFTFRCVWPDGTVRHIEGQGGQIVDAESNSIALRGTAQDISERIEKEAALKLTQFASDHAPDGIFWVDKQARICYTNEAARRELDFTRDELLAMSVNDLNPNMSVAAWSAHWAELTQKITLVFETTHRRKDGSIFPVEVSANFLKFDGKEFNVAYVRNISERKRIEQDMLTFAFHDLLTGLPNRRSLVDRLNLSISASKRSNRNIALMYLDLDNFKPLNDTYGHDAGDLLLIEVAHRLVRCVREVDTVARFGGDEFVVMLGELDEDKVESFAQASIVAEKIQASLSEPYFLTFRDGYKTEVVVEHRCSASIGVLVFNHEASAEDALKWADMAMYQAKKAGRNEIRFYSTEA